MTDQWLNLLPALAQRRDPEPDHVQPIEEVFAEPPFGYQRLDGHVGRRDDPDVDLHRSWLSHRLDFARVEKPE